MLDALYQAIDPVDVNKLSLAAYCGEHASGAGKLCGLDDFQVEHKYCGLDTRVDDTIVGMTVDAAALMSELGLSNYDALLAVRGVHPCSTDKSAVLVNANLEFTWTRSRQRARASKPSTNAECTSIRGRTR